MLYIAQYRFLIPFVLSFTFMYTLTYGRMVGAISTPAMHYFIPYYEDEAMVDPLPIIVEEEDLDIVTIDITDYTSFPDPKSEGSYEGYRDLLEFVYNTTGVDLKLLATVAAVESGFRSDATPGGDNSAKGLYQFIDSTWKDVVTKHGSKYGVTLETSPFDPKANAIMGAMYIKDHIKRFEGRDIKTVDIYLSHFLGPAGARKFLSAPEHEVAAKFMPRAAKRNKNIFYNNKKPLTIKEVYASLDERIVQKTVEFNIN